MLFSEIKDQPFDLNRTADMRTQNLYEMDLFLYDSHLGKRLFNSEPAFNATPPQKLTVNNEVSCHFELIYFCGAVQALGLDFLPMYCTVLATNEEGSSDQGQQFSQVARWYRTQPRLAFRAINLGNTGRGPSD